MNDFIDVTTMQFGWLVKRLPLMLTLYAAPLLLLAWRLRIHPNVPLLAILGLTSFSAFSLLLTDEAFMLILAADLMIAVFATIDLFTLPKQRDFSAERETLRVASLRQNHRMTLTISNRSTREYFVRVRDDIPAAFTASEEEFGVRLSAKSRALLQYDVKASRRGEFKFALAYLAARSRWGLWTRYLTYPVESMVHVYPDMRQLSQYAILARTNRLSLLGVRRTRKIGTDNEFERLRDYTLDDNYKHLDWRSTARRNKLTVRDFQTSQSQRIIFMLDCGRMMTNHAGELTLFDHSLNAMLMLAYVALAQGDAVGLLCFSDSVHNFVPPQGGKRQMNRLLHTVFNRFPQQVESRYDQAFLYLNTHCKKRSLVVLTTNVIDEVNAHQVQGYLSNLVGKHLPLGVLLRDHRLFDIADQPVSDDRTLFHAAAAAEILTWRHQVLTDLEHKGVLMLDTFPEDMTAPLVNSYLQVKARQLL